MKDYKRVDVNKNLWYVIMEMVPSKIYKAYGPTGAYVYRYEKGA